MQSTWSRQKRDECWRRDDVHENQDDAMNIEMINDARFKSIIYQNDINGASDKFFGR